MPHFNDPFAVPEVIVIVSFGVVHVLGMALLMATWECMGMLFCVIKKMYAII